MDLGAPTSYLALEKGVPVYSSESEQVGEVEHVLADPDADVFDGIILDMSAGPGGHRFVDAPEVQSIHERGVVLALGRAEAERLPEPAPGPGELDVNPADAEEGPLQEKLRRAWDYLSGNY
jgi:hypothetical protein